MLCLRLTHRAVHLLQDLEFQGFSFAKAGLGASRPKGCGCIDECLCGHSDADNTGQKCTGLSFQCGAPAGFVSPRGKPVGSRRVTGRLGASSTAAGGTPWRCQRTSRKNSPRCALGFGEKCWSSLFFQPPTASSKEEDGSSTCLFLSPAAFSGIGHGVWRAAKTSLRPCAGVCGPLGDGMVQQSCSRSEGERSSTDCRMLCTCGSWTY
mmetsp:Transcript_18042/g.29739  ORF Transcript_18042/g.29739 Transcript_18042/m.29739 type:complete len:208 (+) Transcript_18042:1485-2108(+)